MGAERYKPPPRWARPLFLLSAEEHATFLVMILVAQINAFAGMPRADTQLYNGTFVTAECFNDLLRLFIGNINHKKSLRLWLSQ